MVEISLKVSVIIPTYNRIKYIETAINSVLSQTVVVDEIIIIDDGSTDGTDSLLANYSKKYPQIMCVKQVNRGSASARNGGILIAKNPIIAFLDSDDSWHNNHIEEAIKCFSLNPDVGLLFAKYEIIDSGNRYNDIVKYSKYKRRDHPKIIAKSSYDDYYIIDSIDCISNLLSGNVGFLNSTLVVNNNVIKHKVLYDENIKIGEDVDYWLQLLSNVTRLAYIDRMHCNYVIHDNNQVTTSSDSIDFKISKLKNIVKHVEKKLLYCRNNADYCAVYGEISSTYSNLAGLLADAGLFNESYDWYFRSCISRHSYHNAKHLLLYNMLGVKGYSFLHKTFKLIHIGVLIL